MELTKKAKIILLVFCTVFAASYFYINREYFLPKPPAKEHKGIVSLSPLATEVLVSLKIQDVMGVSNDSEFPDTTRRIKRMGTDLSPDVKEIILAVPEILFADYNVPKESVAEIAQSGVRTIIVSEARTVEDILFNVNFIAANAGQNSEAFIKQLKMTAGPRLRPSVKVFINIEGKFLTVGYLNFINDVLSYSGMRNIFGNIGENTLKVSWQQVVAQNPDIIIDIGESSVDYSSLEGAQDVGAVKNHRVYKLSDTSVLSYPSPRTFKTIAYLKTLAEDIK